MHLEARHDASDEFVALASFLDAWEASRTRELLERHDIRCTVQRGSRSVDSSGVHHRVVMQVWVPRLSRARAFAIVEAHRAAQRRLGRDHAARAHGLVTGTRHRATDAEARGRRAVLLAMTVGFGMGHGVAGAWGRSACFAAIDLFTVLWIVASWNGGLFFTPIVMRLMVMVTDAVGGYLWAVEEVNGSVLEH
jgi:hypothetical protein